MCVCIYIIIIIIIILFIYFFFCIWIYFSGAGWAAASNPTNQLPVHLWDEEQMGSLLFKGPVLWGDEESHEAS